MLAKLVNTCNPKWQVPVEAKCRGLVIEDYKN